LEIAGRNGLARGFCAAADSETKARPSEGTAERETAWQSLVSNETRWTGSAAMMEGKRNVKMYQPSQVM
jgi:hypothetical protein